MLNITIDHVLYEYMEGTSATDIIAERVDHDDIYAVVYNGI